MKQHYIPQFYLRNFGNKDCISLYNIKRKIHVSNASIKNQCQKSDLYSDVKGLERDLGQLEHGVARAIHKIIETNQPPIMGSSDHLFLTSFILIQRARTPAAGNKMNGNVSKLAKTLLEKEEYIINNKIDLESVEFKYKNSIIKSIVLLAPLTPLIEDLRMKILYNKTQLEYITSDSPIVLFNQWCQRIKNRGTRGLASSGLQIFFPLSPRHLLLLYDENIYKVGKRRQRFIDIYEKSEIIDLNKLQLYIAEHNIYYSGNLHVKKVIDQHSFERKSGFQDVISIDKKGVCDDGKVNMLIYDKHPSVKINIEQIKFINDKKFVCMSERINRRVIAERNMKKYGI